MGSAPPFREGAGLVQKVELLRLATPADPQPFLPSWAIEATVTPASWPELEEQYVVKVTTDSGGEGCFGPCPPAVGLIVRDQIAPAIASLDASSWRVFDHLVPLGRHLSGAHFRIAWSAVELALWDLRSKVAGCPIDHLLGGRMRNAVRAYAGAIGIDVTHPLSPEIASWLREQGFTGQKWALEGRNPQRELEAIGRIRAAVGDECPLMIDARGRWSAAYARRALPRLGELDIAWVEEAPSLARESRRVAFAGGEHAYDPYEQQRLLDSGAIEVWQPDVGWHGGLGQALRMADRAGELGLRVFPHGGCLPGALALAAVTPPAVVPAVEYHLTTEPRRSAVLVEPLQPISGEFAVRSQPGLTAGYRFSPSEAR